MTVRNLDIRAASATQDPGTAGPAAPNRRVNLFAANAGPAAPKRRVNLFAAKAGFTLIELLIVIALISILASMGIVQYRNSIQNAKEAILRTDLFRMRDAIDQYYADKAKYPASLDALVTDGYMRQIPEDPITKSTDTWQTIPAEPDPGNPSADPGIYNIKSGAPGTGLDGTPYADW